MVTYVFTLFVLGLLALLFNVFGIFEWFTPWWAAILMVVSLGMLTRIMQKEKERERERLAERVQELETLLKF